MPDIKKDKDREYRIDMEIVVDAYNSEERSMGWFYYVADNCNFPFKAKCIAERRTSPLNINDEVVVLDAAPAEECEREVLVDIEWGDRKLSVPLSQLEGIDTDDETRQITEDWHYWVRRGYEF